MRVKPCVSRRAWAASAAAALACLLAAAGCGRPPAGPPATPNFNVVLISIDTTRADRLGCYGFTGAKTPNIDRLAREGVLFEQCITSAPLTLPAHASLLTGMEPFVHKLRDNAIFQLQPAIETLAETLRQAGWRTHAETAAFVLNREFGLDQGFDTYNDVRSSAARSESSGMEERPAESVSDGAIAWLRSNAGSRFFLFLHYFDPHLPYLPPPRFRQPGMDPYSAEIAYADEQIGRVLDELRDARREPDTLVIVTSDHGEGLGEHRELTHGSFAYDTTLRVPLILWSPGAIPAGRRVPAQVRLIDVAPTVLALVGAPALPQAQGVSLQALLANAGADPMLAAYSENFYPRYNLGYSHLRAWREAGWKYIHGPKPELFEVARDPAESANLAAQQPERLAAMRESLRRYIESAPSVVAGDARRALDAQDLQRLQALGYLGAAAAEGDEPAEMELFEPSGESPMDHAEELELTSRAMALVALGPSPQAEQTLRSLLKRAPTGAPSFAWANGNLAGLLAQTGRYEEALPLFQACLAANPRDGQMQTNYGIALLRLERLDEAIEALGKALLLEPVQPITHEALAVALSAKGRVPEALAQLDRAVQLEPGLARLFDREARTFALASAPSSAPAVSASAPADADRRRDLAVLAADLGVPTAARALYESWLADHPDDAVALALLGEAQGLAGDLDAAVASLRRAVEADPSLIRAWDFLGVTLHSRGDVAEAVDAFRKGLALKPDNPSIANELAWILATARDDKLRDGAEAVRLADVARAGPAGSNPSVLDTYAAALAEAGEFEKAVAAVRRAIELARAQGQEDFAKALAERQALYEKRQPFREAK